MKYYFNKVDTKDIEWDIIESIPGNSIYKTREWFDFLFRWKKISPFVVSITLNDVVVGYFIGEQLKKVIKIIGSPFEGICTSHQGISMLVDITESERLELYRNLSKWIFKNKYALFLQVEDWDISMNTIQNTEVYFEGHGGYVIDLTRTEEELWSNLSQKSCRYSINKSIKMGITVRQAKDLDEFINTYYEQLVEVFKKQGLTPTYSKKCIESLIKALYPQRILLLEAITQEGEIAATGIFPGNQNVALFFGGASFQRFQKLCPNEPLIWEAIKFWKKQGTKIFNMCGIRPYKLKFGPTEFVKPRIIFAKYHILITMKRIAKYGYYFIRQVLSKFRK